MIVEVFSAVFLPFTVYFTWRYFYGYKRVHVLIACPDDALRRAITIRITDDGNGSDGDWPVRMIGATLYKRRFDWDEYCFLELNSYPARFMDFMERVNVIVFAIDSTQSDQDQIDSLELFNIVVNTEPLKNARLLIYALKRDPKISKNRNATDDEIIEIYGLERLTQKWHIQPVAVPPFIGLKGGMDWIRAEMKYV